MKTTKRVPLLVAMGMLLSIAFIACNKSDNSASSGASNLSLYLTDGPLDFQKVLVDIKSVQVMVDTCHRFGDDDKKDDDQHNDTDHHDANDDRDTSRGNCSSWATLAITPGIYNILTLRNGVDTLLGSSTLPAGKIIKIKINLGTNNSVQVDNVVSPLKLKDNVNFVVVHVRNEHFDNPSINNFKLFLDFDLARSIVYDGGSYWLRPQLQPFCKKNTGEISGKVTPLGSYGLIKAYNSTDTAYALPDRDRDGDFKIRGLKTGTYNVLINGLNGYKDSVITNVNVQKEKEVKLGTIVLHK